MIKKIAFVAHPTTDLQGSLEFYGEILGLERTAYHEMGDKAWVEFDTPDGKTLALDMFSPENAPQPSPYVALETDDIEAELARLKERGVQVMMDLQDNRRPDGTPICKMAIVVDPNGNPIMLHEIAPERAGS